MKTVIQKVAHANVMVANGIIANIGVGLLILIGIEDTDDNLDIDWLVSKIVNIRIFNDANGIMNLSIKDVNGDILVVSQFTLMASTKKGNRPSYIKASKPEIAYPIYKNFVAKLQSEFSKPVQTGRFGEEMTVSLANDGPTTIIIDTKNKF